MDPEPEPDPDPTPDLEPEPEPLEPELLEPELREPDPDSNPDREPDPDPDPEPMEPELAEPVPERESSCSSRSSRSLEVRFPSLWASSSGDSSCEHKERERPSETHPRTQRTTTTPSHSLKWLRCSTLRGRWIRLPLVSLYVSGQISVLWGTM